MTGPRDSVLGREISPVLSKFKNGMPSKFTIASAGPVHLEGLLITLNPQTGKAVEAKRVRIAEDPTTP